MRTRIAFPETIHWGGGWPWQLVPAGRLLMLPSTMGDMAPTFPISKLVGVGSCKGIFWPEVLWQMCLTLLFMLCAVQTSLVVGLGGSGAGVDHMGSSGHAAMEGSLTAPSELVPVSYTHLTLPTKA